MIGATTAKRINELDDIADYEVTVHLKPVAMNNSPTMCWGPASDFEYHEPSGGLGYGVVVVVRRDGEVQLVNEAEIQRIEIVREEPA